MTQAEMLRNHLTRAKHYVNLAKSLEPTGTVVDEKSGGLLTKIIEILDDLAKMVDEARIRVGR